MKRVEREVWGLVAILLLAIGLAAPAEATSLRRASLDGLVASNRLIVVGEVLDAASYWNADGTFMLTDVRVGIVEALKGEPIDRELTVTLMGGTIGDTTTLIVGGAELVPGRAYVLFLDRQDLPSTEKALTVSDHCQGVFDLEMKSSGLRAVSQARKHGLIPDSLGLTEPPGGTQGIAFQTFIQQIREAEGRQRRERQGVIQ